MRSQNVSLIDQVSIYRPGDVIAFPAIFLTDKMCVPDLIYRACLALVENTPSHYATIRCVAARDRMECLHKVNEREADFLAVDPEDMYVAFHMPNQDFSVFSEIRTVVEPDGRQWGTKFLWKKFIYLPPFQFGYSQIPIWGNHFGAQEFWHSQLDRYEWEKIMSHRLRPQCWLQNSHHQIEKSWYPESIHGPINVTGGKRIGRSIAAIQSIVFGWSVFAAWQCQSNAE